jgi:hypothetical protein
MRALAERCVDLAWSQWVVLGVSGSGRTPKHAIDLEALIVFTAALADLDPRLVDEALDCCIQHGAQYVSVSRLRHVLDLFEPPEQLGFGAFAAVVNGNAGSKWPTFDRPARRFEPSGKSRPARLRTDALLQLRSRRIFGIGARADILANLLFSPEGPKHTTTASMLVQLGYTKRAIADVLDDLAEGGVMTTPVRLNGTVRYGLHKRDSVRDLLGPLPESFPPWPERLAVVTSLLRADLATATKSATIRSVELRKIVDRRAGILAAVNEAPPPLTPGIDPWPEIVAWLEPLLIP